MESVVIVGAGPVGLFLAAELALAGVTPLVLERLAEPDPRKNEYDRGLTTRTMQTLAARGLADETTALAAAAVRRLGAQAGLSDLPDDLPTLLDRLGMSGVKGDFAMLPFIDRDGTLADLSPPLMVLQGHFEAILARRVAELGVPVHRGRRVMSLAVADDHVRVEVADGPAIETAWLVGCDGGRSTVRKRGGFDFPGTGPSMVARIAVADTGLEPGFHRVPAGIYAVAPPPAPSMTIEFTGDAGGELTAAEFAASLRRVSGRHVTLDAIDSPVLITDNARQASTYRRGRVLLAGDAAHVHSPIGGQGLNLGLQDAANLGWKLGLVAHGHAPADLLDTYTAERHPVGAEVLRTSRAETALLRTDPQTDALRDLLAKLLPDAQRHLVELIHGLRIRYDLGESPPAGTFAPAAVEHLRDGRGVLLAGPALHEAAAPWSDRVRCVPAADAMLVRPDGYLAWAGTDPGDLRASLARWFGAGKLSA